MSVLRRKQELEAISFRLPVPLKRDLKSFAAKLKRQASISQRRLQRRLRACASRSEANSTVDRVVAGKFRTVSTTLRTGNCSEHSQPFGSHCGARG